MDPGGSIGSVTTRFFTYGGPDDPVRLQSGASLAQVTLAYELYGEVSPDKDNVVLVIHALTGSQHAAGWNEMVGGIGDRWTEECCPGWWDPFIGSGRAIDTDRFAVLCVNYLGGCYGSTGPASLDPETGRPYGSTFPAVTFDDIVDSQVRLLDHLGIDRLHAVVGGSVGGQMCLSLATRYPQRVSIVIPIATGLATTVLQRLHNFEQKVAILHDPDFADGDFYGGSPPDRGLALARMIGHKTFVSLSAIEERARGEVTSPGDALGGRIRHPLESYMWHQGSKFVLRFDANTYLLLMEAWQRYDLVAEHGGSAVPAFARCRHQRYMVFSIDSDVCYYPEEQEALVGVLKSAKVPVRRITVHSDKGHDSFLLEPELFAPHLADTLEREWKVE